MFIIDVLIKRYFSLIKIKSINENASFLNNKNRKLIFHTKDGVSLIYLKTINEN